MGEYDKIQDDRIAANAEAIRKQSEYLREIRDHFIPESESRMKRFAKMVVVPIIKTIALVAFIGGMWDVIAWVYARYEVKCMADRYVSVAKDMYYLENNPEVATEFLDKAIELRDGDAEYRFLRAYIEGMAATRLLLNLDRPFMKSELDKVHHAYAEARFLQDLKPDRPEPYILQSQVLAALKDTKRAQENLAKALSINPNSSFVHLRLAMLQLDANDSAAAKKSLDRALELDPKSKWALLWKGIIARDFDKNLLAARDYYKTVLKIDPRFDMAYYNMGWTWMSGPDKDYSKVREFMQKALAINPDYKEACYAIGMSYGHENNYGAAKVWMDKAIAIDPNFLTAYKWRGIICGEMGRNEEAITNFDTAIRLDPMNDDLFVRRSKAELSLGRNDDALRDLLFAYELSPNNKRTLLYLGDWFDKNNKPDKAIEWYDKALKVEENYDEAFARKAEVFQKTGKLEEALGLINKAIEVSRYKPERHQKLKDSILSEMHDKNKQ